MSIKINDLRKIIIMIDECDRFINDGMSVMRDHGFSNAIASCAVGAAIERKMTLIERLEKQGLEIDVTV